MHVIGFQEEREEEVEGGEETMAGLAQWTAAHK